MKLLNSCLTLRLYEPYGGVETMIMQLHKFLLSPSEELNKLCTIWCVLSPLIMQLLRSQTKPDKILNTLRTIWS